MRRIGTALLAVLCLLPTAAAEGKGIPAAKVCGISDCRDVDGHDRLATLPFEGRPTDPPAGAAVWYRMEVSVHADRERESYAVAVVPSARRMRGDSGDWLEISGGVARELRQLVKGLEPHPASTLGDLEPARARVDEVLEPPVERSTADGPPWPWIAGAGALVLLALGAVALGLRRRRRLPPTAPAEG